MSNINTIDELFTDGQDLDLRKEIIEQLLNNENLETKTELHKPLRWSCLDTIKDFIEQKQLSKSANILKKFVNKSYQLLISHKREGRKEYVEALKSLSMGVDVSKQTNPLNPLKEIG